MRTTAGSGWASTAVLKVDRPSQETAAARADRRQRFDVLQTSCRDQVKKLRVSGTKKQRQPLAAF
jgi:hypothetical protein